MYKKYKHGNICKSGKIKQNIVWKKRTFRNNQMILIHSNLNNRIILIHSNVSKSFKKQHTNMLYCFANRRSLDESSNSIDEKFFLNKIEITRFIRSLFSLTTRERDNQKSGWIEIESTFSRVASTFLIV